MGVIVDLVKLKKAVFFAVLTSRENEGRTVYSCFNVHENKN